MNNRHRIIFIFASLFLIWTLAIHIDRRIDENYENKIIKTIDFEADKKLGILLQDQVHLATLYNNGELSSGNFSLYNSNLLHEKINLLERLILSNLQIQSLNNKRINRFSLLYFIYPELKQKDILYSNSINLYIESNKAIIADSYLALKYGSIGTSPEILNEASVASDLVYSQVAKGNQAQSLYNDYYQKYRMDKTLFYQSPKGLIISAITSVSALFFFIWVMNDITKPKKFGKRKYVSILLSMAAFIYFYSFMFFGPLMLLPKIPYLSW
jgi:hypothetical protein